MKYQLIIYVGDASPFQDIVIHTTNDIVVFDEFAQAVADGKHATLNERQANGGYITIKLKFGERVVNNKEKPE